MKTKPSKAAKRPARARKKHLAGQPWLLPSGYSVADIYLFVVSGWGQYVGVDISGLHKLMAFRERVASRPAARALLTRTAAGTRSGSGSVLSAPFWKPVSRMRRTSARVSIPLMAGTPKRAKNSGSDSP